MAAPRTSTILYNHDFNPNYDITWSVQFLLSGNTNSSGGWTTFLTDRTTFTSPGTGIDVGYSGQTGLSGAKVCVGFDTTGLFATTFTYPDASRRDGIALSARQANMLVVRGGFPDFNLIYSAPLSALASSLDLLSFTENYQTLRFRLGNVGRTLYIDWRSSDVSSYIPLTSVNVNLSVVDSSAFYVGYSFTTPVSTTFGWKESVLYLRQPLHEGVSTVPTYTTTAFTPIVTDLCMDCLLPTQYYTVSASIPDVPKYITAVITYIVFIDCDQINTTTLFGPSSGDLTDGPLYIDNLLSILYTGGFVYDNITYTVLDGFVTGLSACN